MRKLIAILLLALTPLSYGGKQIIGVATFTRPADTTTYTSGDLVANSVTAGSVVPLAFSIAPTGGSGKITRVRVFTSSTSVTLAQFRVHFYKFSPVPANGDNGVWLTPHSGYMGSFDVTVDKVFSDGAKGVGFATTGVGTDVRFDAGTGNNIIYALIEARAAYVPTSAEVFIVDVECEQSPY